MAISRLTSNKPAPSCMNLRAALSRCVSGKIRAMLLSRGGAPSKENQTPDKNILGQQKALALAECYQAAQFH